MALVGAGAAHRESVSLPVLAMGTEVADIFDFEAGEPALSEEGPYSVEIQLDYRLYRRMETE